MVREKSCLGLGRCFERWTAGYDAALVPPQKPSLDLPNKRGVASLPLWWQRATTDAPTCLSPVLPANAVGPTVGTSRQRSLRVDARH